MAAVGEWAGGAGGASRWMRRVGKWVGAGARAFDCAWYFSDFSPQISDFVKQISDFVKQISDFVKQKYLQLRLVFLLDEVGDSGVAVHAVLSARNDDPHRDSELTETRTMADEKNRLRDPCA